MDSTFLFSILLIAPGAGAIISLIPKKKIEIISSLISAALTVGISLILLILGVSGSTSNGYFYSDGLTRIMIITISSIFLTSVIYSTFYTKKIKEPFLKFRWYYCLLDLFVFTMLLAIVVNDLGFIWLAVEATTVTSALLIALEKERTSIEAAWRYTLIVSAGLVISLFSVILVFYSQGTLDFTKLIEQPVKNTLIMSMAIGFALIGYGTKAGIAPMHAWLPDAHSEAPAPISAMFSAILLPTSLYAFIRTFTLLKDAPQFAEMQSLVIGFGLFTALIAAIIIGNQRNYKRMLAYSSMENMGIILVGFALGGIGTLGAIIQIISHAFAKSSAFYTSGNIVIAYNTKKISDTQGIIDKLKSTGYLFILSCFSVTGAPPFGVFLGEFLILSQAVQSKNFIVAIILSIVYMYTFIGLNRQTVQMVFGQKIDEGYMSYNSSVSSNSELPIKDDRTINEVETKEKNKKENWVSILVPLVNLVISLIIGIYMFPIVLQSVTTGLK